ncbi:hypothetical protein BDN70DRAFT_819959 [Pholiota conissans]|uniref:Uncharacterized protein n=1 Tax=Pholiota conissans TaxID=109636 RepID=A0A9P6CSV4_9AGAR|nr:hypothetical protein BDN70DRAFT_819959 [Pholiota conissans]
MTGQTSAPPHQNSNLTSCFSCPVFCFSLVQIRRMVNPGAFSGSRKDFLAAQADLYEVAVTNNHVADTVADIQRRYFKRYPISLPHNKEPSAEWLSSVNDNAPENELLPPDSSQLDGKNLEDAEAAYNEQVKTLKFRKEQQISRRLHYQYTKAKAPSKHRDVDIIPNDPLALMQAKLTGVSLKKPQERVKNENVPTKQRAALRLRICKESFEELEQDERKEYEKQAVQEQEDAVAKIEKALNDPPSEDPVDRQRVLTTLPNFIQPVLDLVTQHSGWKATLLIGGPEPADNGRLNVMSFHSGETSGSVKMNFGRAERRAYKDYVLPIFGNFLKKCYTVEDCRAAALSDPEVGTLANALQNLEGNGYELNSAEGSSNFVKIARTPGARSVSGGSSNSLDSDGVSNDPPSTPRPLYEVPAKVRPPIHSKRTETVAAAAQETSNVPSTLGEQTLLQQAATTLTSDSEAGVAVAPSRIPSPCVSIAPSPVPKQLSTAPDWFLSIYQMFISTNLGPAWMQLVRTWAQFEKVENYKEMGKLGSSGRPSCVASWIKYARSANFRPDIGSLPLFEKTGNLSDLRRPGKNGLVSVIAALFFWGIRSQEKGDTESNRGWHLAIDDVQWVIHHLFSK